jgi:tetratricopeptide (TPR) repeat protein
MGIRKAFSPSRRARSDAPYLRRFGQQALRMCPLRAVAVVALAISLASCAPPGPEALLQGEQLIKQGRYEEAVARLKKATVMLPKNAQAWNHLGLAYHGNRQPEEAARAYQAALALDKNLAAPHYNLGCLYLDQNNLAGATNELTTYTLVQKSHVEGWLKLGVAQLRAKRLDAAEHCFRAARDLDPRHPHPEALNNLGVIQFQRHRWQDAHNYFNLALAHNPDYGPAQLNIAIVNHQALNNRASALKQYLTYLASLPRGPEREAVEAIARQLDEELKPPTLVLRPVATNPPATTTVRTSTVAAAPAPPRAALSPPPAVAARTNPAPAASSPRVHATPTNRQSVAARPPVEPPRVASNPPPRAVEIPATAVSDDLIVKPAQDLPARAATAPASRTAPAPAASGNPTNAALSADAKSDAAKRSLIARLNPFSRKPKEPEPGKGSATGTNAAAAPGALPPATPVEALSAPAPVPRYPYQSVAAPRPGNRALAQPAFDRGVKAHQAGKPAQAIEEYQNALRADPAYFDACYNLGRAAQDTGDLGLALIAYETALALKPDSSNARYNFALALKDSGYAQDAADQLGKLLASNPSELRAHLSLANLGAQQLRQPALAREHYTRVLELNPNHKEAGKIRAWLANNP